MKKYNIKRCVYKNYYKFLKPHHIFSNFFFSKIHYEKLLFKKNENNYENLNLEKIHAIYQKIHD